MAQGRLVIGTRRYSSWSMRGWLAVRLAGLDVTETVIRLDGGDTAAVRDATPAGLVPYLEHADARIWESLAICEYCAEQQPSLWPRDPAARAWARSIAAEMHAGFCDLRSAMPMNLGRRNNAAAVPSREIAADIARIEAIWQQTRAAFGAGGPYLFGVDFGAADAMFAPVVTRLLSYRPEISPATQAYCDAVRAHKLVDEWYRLALAEPRSWRLDKYESVD